MDEVPRASVSAPREGLATQLAQLETYVANAQEGGEALPAEVSEMIERLREIISALDGLTASLSSEGASPRQSE